jgi:aquaporin NIP
LAGVHRRRPLQPRRQPELLSHAAALLLLAIWPGHPANLGATVPSIAVGRALVLEAVLTALLMLVIMSMATETRAVGAPAALVIAAAVGLAAIAFGPLTGASLNTARSLGPALASGQWHDFWIYVAGPLIGAPLGALAYEFVRGEHPQAPTLTDDSARKESDGDRAVRLPA